MTTEPALSSKASLTSLRSLTLQGNGSYDSSKAPTLALLPSNEKAAMIRCGSSHCAVVTQNGDLYTWCAIAGSASGSPARTALTERGATLRLLAPLAHTRNGI